MSQALYRFFGTDDELLYIGITADPGSRWKAHASDKPWWTEVVRTTIEHYETRKEVETAEAAAIRSEHPKYNVTYNSWVIMRAENSPSGKVESLRPLAEESILACSAWENVAASVSLLANYSAASFDECGNSAIEKLADQFSNGSPDRLAQLLTLAMLRLADGHSFYSTDARPPGLYPSR